MFRPLYFSNNKILKKSPKFEPYFLSKIWRNYLILRLKLIVDCKLLAKKKDCFFFQKVRPFKSYKQISKLKTLFYD